MDSSPASLLGTACLRACWQVTAVMLRTAVLPDAMASWQPRSCDLHLLQPSLACSTHKARSWACQGT